MKYKKMVTEWGKGNRDNNRIFQTPDLGIPVNHDNKQRYTLV